MTVLVKACMQPGVPSQFWIWKAAQVHARTLAHTLSSKVCMMLSWSSLEAAQSLVAFYSLCCINNYFWNALGCCSGSFSLLWRGLKRLGEGREHSCSRELCVGRCHTQLGTAASKAHCGAVELPWKSLSLPCKWLWDKQCSWLILCAVFTPG